MNKTALITGGAKRIGAEIVKTLIENEYNVIIHYNNSFEEANILQKSFGGRAKLFKADLTKLEELQGLIDFVGNDLDILVNNASIFQKKIFAKQTQEEIIDNINIHLTAPLLLTKHFSEIGGKILINLLDLKRMNTEVIEPYGDYFTYSLTKHTEYLMHQYLCSSNQKFKIYGIALGNVLSNQDNIEFFATRKISKDQMTSKISEVKEIIKKILIDKPENQIFKIT